jgi:hypothetical protein
VILGYDFLSASINDTLSKCPNSGAD